MQLDAEDLTHIAAFLNGLNQLSNDTDVTIGLAPVFAFGEEVGLIELSDNAYVFTGQ